MKLFVTLSLLLLGTICASSAFADVAELSAAAIETAAPSEPEAITTTGIDAAAVDDVAVDDALIEVQPIQVREYVDTLDIQNLDNVTNAMSKAVRLCMGQGMGQEKTNVECLCENKTQSKKYQETLVTTLESHPEWAGNVAHYTDTQGVGVTISFIGHQRQSDMLDNLECPE